MFTRFFTNTYCQNVMHTHTHTRTHTQSRTCVRTHTHTPVTYQGSETKGKVSKKIKVFKEDLKELTDVEWQTETGSWFQITGVMLFCLTSNNSSLN